MKHGPVRQSVDAFGQSSSSQKVHRMIGAVGVVHLKAHDLAAVHVQDDVQIEPLAHDATGEERQVPAPQLSRRGRDMRTRWPFALRGFRPTAMVRLPMCPQYATEAGFA